MERSRSARGTGGRRRGRVPLLALAAVAVVLVALLSRLLLGDHSIESRAGQPTGVGRGAHAHLDARTPGAGAAHLPRRDDAEAPRALADAGLPAAGFDPAPPQAPRADVLLAGRVVRVSDGSPVPQVVVEALGPPGSGDPRTGTLSLTRTQFDGAFLFLGRVEPPHVLRLTYADIDEPVQVVELAAEHRRRTDLQVPLDTGWSLSVRVLAPDGTPAAGARLAQRTPPLSDGKPVATAAGRSEPNDAPGLAVLHDLSRRVADVTVTVSADGLLPRLVAVRPPSPDAGVRHVTVRLEPGAVVTGRVEAAGPTGRQPARRATVTLIAADAETEARLERPELVLDGLVPADAFVLPGSVAPLRARGGERDVRTDAAGWYSAPAVPRGRYVLHASWREFADDRVVVRHAYDRLVVDAAAEVRRDVVLVEAGALTGRVLDTDGAPVPGVLVKLSHVSSGGGFPVMVLPEVERKAGPDGSFRFEHASPGEKRLAAEWEGRTAELAVSLGADDAGPVELRLSP